jgi:hypothetical protein
LIGEKCRRASGRAAGDLFAPQLFDVFDIFLADEEQQWLGDREEQNLHRLIPNCCSDGAGHSAVVIDVSVQNCGACQVGRHEDDFEIDSFILKKSTVKRGINR